MTRCSVVFIDSIEQNLYIVLKFLLLTLNMPFYSTYFAFAISLENGSVLTKSSLFTKVTTIDICKTAQSNVFSDIF